MVVFHPIPAWKGVGDSLFFLRSHKVPIFRTKSKVPEPELSSVAFCSPAKGLTFSALTENPFVGKKVRVLTAKQNASK